jgi:DNA-binding beta-propeller fold protein YncE
VVEGRVFVLDTNNGRILELDAEGRVINTLDSSLDPHLAVTGAMAMASHGGKLYIANSLAGSILVVSPSGQVEKNISLQANSGEKKPRPIGVAVNEAGDILVADPDNHYLHLFSREGQVVFSLGTGKRDSGQYGFNSPGAVTADREGNWYAVDMLNYTVKKYSPSGEFLLSLGEAGDTTGTFSRPKAVAVDQVGNIYVSDGLLAAVEVFSPEGVYLGFIGREDPTDRNSESLFKAPQGLKIEGNKLYVMDRFDGLFVFDLGNV